MVATTHQNGDVLNSPTINANVAGVQLITGWPGDPRAVPGAPQGATAGEPGEFTPEGSTVPADLVALQALGALGQTDPWGEDEFVELGDESDAYWDGEDWQEGIAPAPDPTGVTAGTPGSFTPPGSAIPANITALRALELLEDGVDPAWEEGEYVVITSGNMHWDGSDWATGMAPA